MFKAKIWQNGRRRKFLEKKGKRMSKHMQLFCCNSNEKIKIYYLLCLTTINQRNCRMVSENELSLTLGGKFPKLMYEKVASFIPVKARSYSSPTSKPLDQLYIFCNDWTSLYVITSPPCWSYLQPDFHKDYFSFLYNEKKVRLRAQSQCCMSFLGSSNTEHSFLLQFSENRSSFSQKNKLLMFSKTSF